MAQKPAPAASQKHAQDIMTTQVICLKGDLSVRDSIKLLMDNKISGAPMVDGTNNILSVVTQGDLLRLAALKGLDVYKKFLTTKLHRLIVVDDGEKLQGIVSRSDILRHLCLEKSEAKL